MRTGGASPAVGLPILRPGALAIVLLGLLAAARLEAQGSATFTSTVSASIAGSILITNTAPLNFGDVIPSAAPGSVSVILTPAAERTAAAGASLSGTTFSAATFHVDRTGSGNKHVGISLPSGTVTLLRVGGGASMTVDTFSSNLDSSCYGPNPKPNACPKTPFDFSVGARLNVGANQAPGVYSGTFAVTANQF